MWPYTRKSRVTQAVLLAMLGASSVHAAEPATDANEAEKAERVEVTGSRLKGVDLEGANPVITVTSEELTTKGYDSIAEFLKDLPQTSSAGTFSEAGGLASGTRGQPAGSAGVSLRGLGSSATLVLINGRRVAVDSFTNGFDTFVDINSIPMSAVDKVEILTDGASSIYGSDAIAGVINFILRKDFDGHEVSLMYGDDTEEGDYSKGNFTYVGGFNTDKSNTTVIVDYYTRNALMNSDRPVDVTFFSSTRVNIDGGTYAEPWCGGNTTNGGTRCEYDYVIQRAIKPDTENVGVTLTHNYEISADTEFFAEFMYQRNEGHAYEAPVSFDVWVDANSPGRANVPQWAVDIDLQDGFADDIRVRSRFPNRRTQEFEDTSLRLLAGLRGSFGDWDWEGAVMHGTTESTITHNGFYQISAVDDAVFDGSFNPFNLGRDNSADDLAALQPLAPRNGESTVDSVDFRVNGDLFSMPAGAVQAVFGAEWRAEDMFDRPDPLTVDDPSTPQDDSDIYGLGSTFAEADRTQYAVYAEFILPLAESFDFIGAMRYDDYSDFGSDVNPKASVRWRATDDLIFRASWSTGFRAPSLSQLGSGTTLGTNFIDCGPNRPFDALCGTFGAANGELEFDQETLGNRDLDAETSEATNIGLSWNLTSDLQMTVDYWQYTHEDIVDVDYTTTLAQCIAGDAPITGAGGLQPGQFGCEVDAAGDLIFVRTGFYNVGAQETDGIDYQLRYKVRTEDAGDFRFYINAVQTLSFERQLTPSDPFEDLLGRLSGANEIGRPDFVADFGVDWDGANWFASVSGNYTSEVDDGDFQFDDHPTVDEWLVWNASLGYDYGEGGRVVFSVRNLLDEEPPFASSPTSGYAASIHDFFGRNWSVRWTQRF